MTDIIKGLLGKPLPTLREFLGEGARAEGFEEWVAENMALQERAKTPQEAAAARMIQIFSIAAVEALRRETEAGMEAIDAMMMMPRCVAWSIMAASLCAIKEDAPYLRVAKIVSDEFAEGARHIAKSALADREREKAEAGVAQP